MNKRITDKLEEFFTGFKHKIYKKGEILIRADEELSGIFYLKSGTVKEYAISRKGEELVINIFSTGSFFPMSWAINNTHNIYYFEAMTDVDIYKTSREDVVAFIKKDPEVLYDLLSRVFKGTDGMLTRMTYLMAGNAYARLVAEIIIHAKRFGTYHSAHPSGTHKTEPPFGTHNTTQPYGSVEVKISETDLASQTGMTRETVSREMKILKDRGFVIFNKNLLHINNLERLEEELGIF